MLAEAINDTRYQWCLGTDDGQADVVLGKGNQLVQLQHVDGDVFALGLDRRAGVARGDKDLLDALILRHFPRQRVLTPAAADNQYIHVTLLWRELQASSCKRRCGALCLRLAACGSGISGGNGACR